MSISLSVLGSLLVVLLAACSALSVRAQDAPARVVLTWEGEKKVRVEGSFPVPAVAFSLPDSAGGVDSLSKRVSELRTLGKDGSEIPHRRGPRGAVFADAPLASYSFAADLAPQADVTLGAHVSWIADGRGLLMLGDLLPKTGTGSHEVRLTLALPDGVKAVSSEIILADGSFHIKDPSKAVFLVSATARRLGTRSSGSELDLVIEGEWQFTDRLAQKMAELLFNHYERIFDSIPAPSIQILLVRAPDETMRDRWRAETRGNTVIIVSSPSTYGNHGEQRLHEQLRHELLHLWIPNSMKLEGEYAWFYEGFVFYRALIAGAELKQITFRDVLGTLSDARRRSELAGGWQALAGSGAGNGEGSLVYSRGTLAAFAAETALIRGTAGKRDLDDVLKNAYRNAAREKTPVPADEYLIRELSAWPQLRALLHSSILGEKAPDWKGLLDASGIYRSGSGQLEAVPKPDSSQKAVLKRLGYNGGR